jgi:hypothetical protein
MDTSTPEDYLAKQEKANEIKEKFKEEAWANRMKIERKLESDFKKILELWKNNNNYTITYDKILKWFTEFKSYIAPYHLRCHLQKRLDEHDSIEHIVDDVISGTIYKPMRVSMGFT